MHANMQVFSFQTAAKKYFNKKPRPYTSKSYSIINTDLICLPEMKMLVQPGVRSSDCYYSLQSHSQVIGTQINLKPNLNLIMVHSMATIKNVL